MYRTKRCPPGPIRAQRTYFCLKPLPPICRSEDEGQLDIGPSSTESKTKCQSRLSDTSSYSTPTTPIGCLEDEDQLDIGPSSTESKTKCQSRLSDTSLYSTKSTPLPVLLARKPTEKLLLRRPNIYKAEPLKRNDELFEAYAKMSELKLLKFDKTADSYKFYLRHFPLLLQKQTDDDQRTGTPTRRGTASPESPMSAMIKRKTDLNKRLTELEAMVDKMEKATEPDDVKFQTELRSPVFDPTSWPFTKVDHKRMLRRYTVDQVLKDINRR